MIAARPVVFLSIGVLVATAACSRTRVEGTLRPDLVGSKYARLTGYMATRGAAPGGRHTEEVPGAIEHDVIRDEATLARVAPSETCVDLVVRTTSQYDEPFDQLSPLMEIDGKEHRAVVESEHVSVYDYSYEGQREIIGVEGVTATDFIGASVSAPAEQVFRVVERRGLVCVPASGTRIELEVTNPSWDVSEYSYHLVFAWTLGR